MDQAQENKLMKWMLGGLFAFAGWTVAFGVDGVIKRVDRVEGLAEQALKVASAATVISARNSESLRQLLENPNSRLQGSASTESVENLQRQIDELKHE